MILQCRVQEVAGNITGERPAGAIGAAHAGREPDDEQTRIGGTERRDRRIVPIRVSAARRLAIGDEARAQRAVAPGCRCRHATNSGLTARDNGGLFAWLRTADFGRQVVEIDEAIGLTA